MNVTAEQTQKVLTGSQRFTQLGLSMLITRLKSIYSKDPSQATLDICTDELNVFLRKYSSILTADYSAIISL